jgi:hypothetical protein
MEYSETSACFMRGGAQGLVFRYNIVEGTFNGVVAYNVDYDRLATMDTDIYSNSFSQISDDTFEPEGQGINWRIWDNDLDYFAVGLSTGPLSYGPVYLFRNRLWKCSSLGAGRDDSGGPGVSSGMFKYSNGTANGARIYVIHNTFWTDETYNNDNSGDGDAAIGVDGGAQNAGGSAGTEKFYIRNHLSRGTRWAFRAPATPNWNEDYNVFVTSHASNGLEYSSTGYTVVATYRTASGQGAHSNVLAATTVQFQTEATVDALFTNTATGNLALTGGASAIDAGIPIPNISDLVGVNYQGAAPDMGYVEAA